jgi:bifunctional DNA-binding transcriptional regulator/antitoxin component of YhaV-PrlF toxin-antitoxin module
MKLLRVKSLEAYGKSYYKFQVTIPPSQVEQVGWDQGDTLESEVRGHEIVLRRKRGGKAPKAE